MALAQAERYRKGEPTMETKEKNVRVFFEKMAFFLACGHFLAVIATS